MKTKVFLPSVFICFVFVSSCHKDDPVGSSTPTYPMYDLTTLQQYVVFKPGTYWIYRDSAGIEDSVFVYAYTDEVDTVHKTDGSIQGVYQAMSSSFHSALDGYDYYLNFNTSWSAGNLVRHQVFLSSHNGLIIILEYPVVIGHVLHSAFSDDDVTTADYFSSYSIDTLHFNEVIKMHESKDLMQNNEPTNYYLAKGAGIIRKELLTSGRVWNLIRYHIVQ